ncbi:MAG: hypothetical protein ABIG32_00115, partial [Candidatus Uhrbacteria bacterium]
EEEATDQADAGMAALQNQYREFQAKRSGLRDQEFEIQKQIELKKVQAEAKWTPLPLPEIIKELETIRDTLKSVSEDAYEKTISSMLERSEKLLTRLKKPAPETIQDDPGLAMELKQKSRERQAVESELKRLEKQMEDRAKAQKEQRNELFEIGRQMRVKQNELHELSNQRNAIQIELARLEEREQNLLREIEIEIRDAELASKIKQERTVETVDTDALYPEIQKLKNQLELIGGIDPETMAEYEEIKSRHEFLDTQTKDLQGAIRSTEKIIDELDAKIKDQSEKAFKEINREFQRYFKLLFGGGSCSLVKMTRDDVEEEETEAETTTERVRERLAGKRDTVIGIDIQATPPGKKLKALNLLSGGERTLTSIALLAAIMATNASPFVVLDEVDAALDEANTLRFASILGELAKLTQFIVITHNRATMEKSDVLYGVTMGDDGVSHLLSVNMEEVDPEAVKK